MKKWKNTSGELKWFEYDQNNSGGSFVVNDKLCRRLFIEAHSVEEANGIAVSLGVYFDGENDCPCCGNRWSEPYKEDGLTFPMEWHKGQYLQTVEEYAQMLADNYGWTKPDCRLFYHNGDLVEIFSNKVTCIKH